MRRFPLMILIVVTLCCVAPATAQQRTFPLMADMAGSSELPLPFGVGLYYFDQTQDYDLTSLGLMPPLVDPELLMMGGVDVENELKELNLKFDMWLFPFLNLHVIVGQVDGTTTVDLEPPAPYDALLNRIEIDYDGLVYGGGLTLAGGGEYYWGSITAAYNKVDPDTDLSTIEAWVITPKLGMNFSFGAIWVGGMYQEASEEHHGSIDLPGIGVLGYDVELAEREQWNYLAGSEVILTEHLMLQIEAGFGDRTHALAALTYRF